ncbi:MAG TPA: hypothetical protein VGJ60_27880 [Chloroflexota bacterium]
MTFLLVIVAAFVGGELPSWTYVAFAVLMVASFAITVVGVPEPARRTDVVERISLCESSRRCGRIGRP